MKIKADTIRIKLILAIFGSAGIASVCMVFLGIILIIASSFKDFAIFFFNHILFFAVAFFIIFIAVMVAFFLLLIRNKVKYLEDITKALKYIPDGELEITIPVKSYDELGIMAETVNDMAYKLKTSIEEERRLQRTKSDLITNISHDLRTPLTSVLGYLQLLKNTDPDDEESLKRYINIAYVKCNDLKVLIDDLFELSKLNNMEITMNKAKISLGELLEQVIIGFIPAFKESGIEYRMFFINEKLFINVDAILLTRVFDNLINNAIKYGREGKYVDVELLKEKNEAVVRIVNYGNTIPESSLPFIFEKYYQAYKPVTGISGSSGLGLAIVKRIIDMHKGTITVSSLNNKTIFEIRIEII